MKSKFSLALILAATMTLSGCFEEKNKNELGFNRPNPPAASNGTPTISGSPSPTVVEGEFYEFTPNAADPDGDTLEFSIARKPGWATFNRSTGRLSGTPGSSDVGNFTNIVITVSDGNATAALGSFDITVDAIALGSATLSWNPPTENTDGTTLSNLTGYRIYYGRSETQLGRTIVINNPGLTRYVIENLAAANWYFSMTSVNSEGVESRRSRIVSKTIG